MKYSDSFQKRYYSTLNLLEHRKRGDGFLAIIRCLENYGSPPYLIVECGSWRGGSMSEDGQSTIIFDEFITHYGGMFYSVDVSAVCKQIGQNNTKNTTFITEDSVKFLLQIDFQPDLLYLDSLDIDFECPDLAPTHCYREFVASRVAYCKKMVVVAIDDCRLGFDKSDPRISDKIRKYGFMGKNHFVQKVLSQVGAELIHDGYQQVWLLNKNL